MSLQTYPAATAARMEAYMAAAFPMVERHTTSRELRIGSYNWARSRLTTRRRNCVFGFIEANGPEVPFGAIRDKFANRFGGTKGGVLANDLRYLAKEGRISSLKRGKNESLYSVQFKQF